MSSTIEETVLEELVRKDAEQEEQIVRKVVSSVSRGNVNLQLGRYVTERDKEWLRNKVFSYEIKAPI